MALIERKVVLTEKDSSGNTVMNFPVTRAEYVEDAVLSVNGSKGDVTIKDYVTGLSVSGKTVTYTKKDGTSGTITTQDTTYTLPTATSSTKGGVTIGDNITVSSGKISLTKNNVTNALGYEPPTTNTTYSAATTSAAGLMSADDKKKLDGIEAGANKYTYTLPTATSSTKGGVTIGSNISVSSGKISLSKQNVIDALGYEPPTTNTTYTHPTYTAKSSGLYKVTVDGTGHVSAATAVTKDDITALGIPAQDTTYSLPTASSSTKGGVKIGSNITISSGVISLSKTNVTTALGYEPLPLGGGTMTGGIVYDVEDIVSRTSDTGASKFFGGTGSNDGASLILSGKSRSNLPAQFNLNACDGTTTTSLLGKPDGTLTWDGKDVLTTTNGIKLTGSRGNLAGYETNGTATTINQSARDSNQTGSNITVSNGTSGTSWTKIVRVTAAVTVTLGSSWVWQGGSAPTIASGGILVCCWCGSGGIANFVSPS